MLNKEVAYKWCQNVKQMDMHNNKKRKIVKVKNAKAAFLGAVIEAEWVENIFELPDVCMCNLKVENFSFLHILIYTKTFLFLANFSKEI